MDHCDTESLKTKYSKDENVAHLVDKIQDIDFVCDGSPIEILIPDNLRFDYVYSSHVLEHQVDFVGHFRSLEKILSLDGKVVLVIPDHRACFDRFRFPTVTSDVIAVHERNQSIHQGKQVYEAFAQSINLNPGRRITRFDLTTATFLHPIEFAYSTVCASEDGSTNYRDVHAWTFTPLSFQLLMTELFLLDLINLRIDRLSLTYGNQFFAVLSLCQEGERDSVKNNMARNRFRLNRKLYS
jgi:hypothetical protein